MLNGQCTKLGCDKNSSYEIDKTSTFKDFADFRFSVDLIQSGPFLVLVFNECMSFRYEICLSVGSGLFNIDDVEGDYCQFFASALT
jgi:hypothetical protein